jgi:hypothetical protein
MQLISLFVDHHAKNLKPEIPIFLHNIPDVLKHFGTLNTMEIPQDAFPVSINVLGLYSNIPLEEGINCSEEALNTRKDKLGPTTLLITLLTLVLILTIFEFNEKLY